jgi:heat shock protein HslJ
LPRELEFAIGIDEVVRGGLEFYPVGVKQIFVRVFPNFPVVIGTVGWKGKRKGAFNASRPLRMRSGAVLAGAMAVLGGCAGGPTRDATQSLAGTAWRLASIQSMDDAQGTTRIADPSRFTLRFEDGGRASLRLDCNRGTASWQAAAATGDGRQSGTLAFGSIAATRALCPPPHLDERIVRDLPNVRSYLFKDGKLYLSLMADGGIYEWERDRP